MSGVAAVSRLEVLLRFRAGRWRWLLLSWFAALVAFTWLLYAVVSRATSSEEAAHRGAVLFGGLQLFMLALALFIVPALTSQSLNGDRERGRLAVLQVTDLSATAIVAGKLLAAWGTATVFVLVSAPLTVWAMTQGGITVLQVIVVTLVMLLLLGIICAVGLGLSALLARSTTSSVLTYVAVFALAVGTLILTALVSAVISSSGGQHHSYPWYLAAPNPFVILADSAPAAPTQRVCFETGAPPPNARFCETRVPAGDVLGGIRESIRSAETVGSGPSAGSGAPLWPYGLVFDLAVAAVLLTAAVRRTTTPVRRVPKGVRIA
jgi:ABC-2 type transport system permease protein